MVAALAPLSAPAGHCNKVYFFSRPVAVAEHNAVGCLVDGTEDTDARFFVPGSTGFTVRYVTPEDPSLAFYWINLSGSLFPTGLRVKAPKTTLTGGTIAYETATVNFPAGRSAAGCVTATVEVVEEDDLASNTYRTLGSTC
jgi:hypothetical protein